MFSACVPPVPGVRSDSKEVCARHEVGMSFARADGGGGPTETEVRAHEGLDRGRSTQNVGVAVAALDEASGELVELVTFPQDLEKA